MSTFLVPNRRQFLGKSALAFAGLSTLTLNTTGAERTSMNTKSHPICTTCGTQFASMQANPKGCPICLDERQYIGPDGQQWTTLEAMRREEWRNSIREQEPSLIGIGTEPRFGIGQRALLVQTSHGNVLWDCISFLDDKTIE